MIKKWINNKELAYLTKYTRCFSRVTYPQMLNHYTSAQAALTLRHHCLVPLYLKFRHGHGTTALPTHPWARTCSDFLLFHHHTTRQVDRKWCSELSLTWFSIWFGLIWFDLIGMQKWREACGRQLSGVHLRWATACSYRALTLHNCY